MNYYKQQLQNLKASKGSSIKFTCEGSSTNYLGLNNESIDEIVAYFKSLKD
jgi:hypothetical protein